MAWRRLGDKPLSESMMVRLLTHICVTRPQWVNPCLPSPMSACMTGQLSHYSDVIMSKIASLITSLAVVHSTVYSDADQRKLQSSASLAFVWGIHRDRWITRTKGQLRGKCFHLMTSSCAHSRSSWLTKSTCWIEKKYMVILIYGMTLNTGQSPCQCHSSYSWLIGYVMHSDSHHNCKPYEQTTTIDFFTVSM